MANMMELNDGNFDAEVIQSDKPVLVDFWGPGCGPCRMLTPLLEELAGENGEKMKFGKVDVSENFALAAKYQIQFIPVVLMIKDGEVVKNFTGIQPKDAIQGMIDEVTG